MEWGVLTAVTRGVKSSADEAIAIDPNQLDSSLVFMFMVITLNFRGDEENAKNGSENERSQCNKEEW